MKKVMVFGTFDGVHQGHLDFFKQAKAHGDFLVAVVARDETVEKVKGKKPANKQQHRIIEVYNVPEVDYAILGNKEDYYKIIEEQKPDIICLGYDQNSFTKDLKEELKKRNISAEIVRLKPFEENKYKSSKINSSNS